MTAKSVAETLAARALALKASGLPARVRATCEDLLLDVGGLCIAARRKDYVLSIRKSVDRDGRCTALGHPGRFGPEEAALLNGTAAHGEDFDDSFEGGPVHSGAVVVPAVLAACERFGRSGRDALLGIAAGTEALCRLSLVAPKKIHDAGFHPTAVLGVFGSTLGVARAMGMNQGQTVNALGIAGSMAGGIIEYLAEGAWTKRLHAGWAAQSGIRAARLAQAGFTGPRTVFEGSHGLFFAFARDLNSQYEKLTDEFGKTWVMTDLTFKPYATGTMNQPYIDCALRLAQRGRSSNFGAEDVAAVDCDTAEGYVHRLWEPLAAKQRPPNDYAAKFSTPFNIAVAFVTGGAGFEAFSPRTVRDRRVLSLAAKVRYRIDPDNPYPARYTGHVRMTLKDGRVFEERQPHIRGGAQEPLTRAELEQKFRANAAWGGWSKARAERFLAFARETFDGKVDLSSFRR